MSKNSTAVRRGASLATMAIVGATAVSLMSQGAASADTFIKLPNGAQRGDDLLITRTNERAQISPSLAANGAGRNAWVSADVTLYAPKLKAKKAGPNNGAPTENNSATQGTLGTNSTGTTGAAATLSVGYIVGCQVGIGSLSLGGGATINNTGAAPSLGLNGSFALPLVPGQVQFVRLNYKSIEKAGTYYVSYDRAQLQVQGCGGYAQARSFTVVETTGDDHQKVTLYGKPFSIG